MSIPPLVCSTPPPPDQCEDDKDPVDFDLQYNLSQDDDESNDYDYGNFSSYNHFQSPILKNKNLEQPVTINETDIETEEANQIFETNVLKNEMEADTISESQLKTDEDINIEDLDLKFDQERLESCNKNNNDSAKETHTNIPEIKSTVSEDVPNIEYTFESTNVNHVEEIIEVELDVKDIKNEMGIIPKSIDALSDVQDYAHTKEEQECLNESANLASEDLDDFDDFHYNSESKSVTIINDCDNPWENKKSEESEFGDFKANFFDSENSPSAHLSLDEHSDEIHPGNQMEQDICEDDDFGDFDDFKSSTVKDKSNEVQIQESVSCQQVPVLNLQIPDNENQITESINTVLKSIFDQEIPETQSDFEGKLESLLSETWGHLMETDVRQPYIVIWNNSLAQKTLLKALCIDSRNILYGPRWSYNMPKYAANLSNAPLQPQKQNTSSSSSQKDIVNSDKNPSKPSDTWTDPFTSDGQESCNTDTASGVVEARPTDLDIFEATLTPKSDKIYSNTLNVQPIRQINLPDTHIFTPTDSETPRSKTIHYDSAPSVLLPQPTIETNKNHVENNTPLTFDNADDLTNDNEYSEFQDFKGTIDSNIMLDTASQPIENTVLSTPENVLPNITYQTQILQPIKVDPIMPSLNWPDPGEVKEVFDDFTDFVSNSSWNNEKQVEPSPVSQIENNESNTLPNGKTSNCNTIEIESNEESTFGDNIEDEFDTFQSALPVSKNTHLEYDLNSINDDFNIHRQNTSPQNSSSSKIQDLAYPKTQIIDPISFTNTTRPNEVLTQNQIPFISDNFNNISKQKESPVISHTESSGMTNTSLLKPTPANSSMTQNQQKTAQILQPLSLESYSQINWPNPGIDLQDLSRFNPVETLQSLKSDLNASGHSKVSSPVHSQKSSTHNNQALDDDIWGEFVSSKPKQQQSLPKKPPTFVDDDEWTDFVSSPSVMPQNGLNTISLNVHTNLNMQKSSNLNKFKMENNHQIPLDIPTLNYITPKSTSHKSYNNKHFQNL